MAADFWAGYASGAIGILIGNPLDLIKVRLQAAREPSRSVDPGGASPTAAARANTARTYLDQFRNASSLVSGAAAPILGYGALNALLFMSYNRSQDALDSAFGIRRDAGSALSSASLWSTWAAGAIGGLATWVVSTPTELIKCRAQVSSLDQSSFTIARDIWQTEGVRGWYRGGTVTALRDSIGYGFYFWSYELSTQWLAAAAGDSAGIGNDGPAGGGKEAMRVLLCGGLAGVVTWASIFPLDVVKTRLQVQDLATPAEAQALLGADASTAGRRVKRPGGWEVAQEAYREGGVRVFFRGLTVCSVRAFIVNAVQWATYEWIMHELGQGRRRN